MAYFFNIEHFSSPYKPCVLVLIYSAFRLDTTGHFPLRAAICYMDILDSVNMFVHTLQYVQHAQ